VLLIGGVVAGIWHQRHSGWKIAITVEPCNLPALHKLGVRLSDRQTLCAGALIKLVFFSPEC
jgi:hypothetical protein